MSNVRKAFQTKSLLRRMADGGIFKSIVNGVPTFTDKDRAAPDAKAYVPTAMRELPNTGIVPGGTALPQAPAAPMPAPAKLSVAPAAPMPAPAKLSVAPAAPMPAPAKLSVAPQDPYSKMTGKPPVSVAPAPAITAAPPRAGMTAPPVPAAPQQFYPQDPYSKMTGKPPVPITPRTVRIPMNYMAQTGGFGPTTVPERRPRAIGSMRKEIGAERQDIGMGYLAASGGFMASGGEVKGPGGPTDDKVGPVMLSDGEYVLPADTVRAVGKENLDKLKDATHTPTNKAQRRGMLRRMADGTPTEEEKRVRAQLAGTIALTGEVPPQPAPPPAAKLVPAAPPTVSPREAHQKFAADQRLLDSVSSWTGAPRPPITPTPAALKTPGWGEKQAPGEVRGPDGSFNTLEPSPPRSTEPDVPPSTLTTAQSNELERMKVSLGDQLQPVNAMKFGDPVDRGAIDRPMVATGEKQINSKLYRDATGAVKEGTATLFRPATEEDINKMPLNIGPRAFSNLTLREGTEPGQQVNLGNGMFGTSSKPGGPIDTFTGVGKDFNADSMRFGPDPEGKDRARQDAMVEQNLQARQTPRGIAMPEVRSNARDINARFDKLAKDAASRFSSPRAAGNLNKALTQIEAQRMQALNQDAENMTRQQQIAATAAMNERDIASRNATAARADETDRLAISAQDRRAADTAAAQMSAEELKTKVREWEVRRRTDKSFRMGLDEFLANPSAARSGSGEWFNADAKELAKRVTSQAQLLYAEQPELMQAVVANKQMLPGDPDTAVITHAEALKRAVDFFGVLNIGVPVKNEKGELYWDATGDQLRKSASGPWDNTVATFANGKAYKFIGPDKRERFYPIGAFSGDDRVDRMVEEYFTNQDILEEWKNRRKERD
jgi:hypothetical protein